ncbi:hypothetical protein BDY24DRAFT_372436 [Mrakia frigida]|uniref:uncharacterized protein n=1 Tax=Mrakia frigida TaxID=29902 RepID=UPI003FCBF6C7
MLLTHFLPSLPFLSLLFLKLSLSTHARVYTDFSNVVPSFWNFGGGGLQQEPMQLTQVLCSVRADLRPNAVGYVYFTGDGGCFTFTGYPPTCSGYVDASAWVTAVVDRCGGALGYVLSPDATCLISIRDFDQIYTGGLAFTRAAYLESCPSNNVVNQALPSPAFKKKRTEEKSAFVGGKICPIGELACPLETGLSCMNVKDNLNSCGGCIGGAGVDCSDLQGVDEVSCVKGKCVAPSFHVCFVRCRFQGPM